VRAVALAGLAAAVLPGRALAQGDCYPGPASNEAAVFGTKSVALAYTALRAPGAARAFLPGVEVSYVPAVDDETATPTICRPGKGPENANLLAVVIRPRLAIGLPAGFLLDLSWIPPVRVGGVKSNLFGLALGWTRPLGGSGTAIAIRAHGTFGTINAPITCPENALADPASECYQGTESDDEYHPNVFGVDAAIGFGRADARVRPYAGLGYNRLQPRFMVNFTNRQGQTDNRKVIVDLDRAVLFAGADWALAEGFALKGEIYAAPADAVTGRVMAEIRVGPTR